MVLYLRLDSKKKTILFFYRPIYDESNVEYSINEFTIYESVGGETTGTRIVSRKEYKTTDGKEVRFEDDEYKLMDGDDGDSFTILAPKKS